MVTDRYSVSGVHPENQYYPNSEILVNRLNIQNEDLLDEFEYLALDRTIQCFYEDVEARISFDSKLLKDIHQVFLGEMYVWAGQYRTVAIKKGHSTFAMPQKWTGANTVS